MTDARGGAGQPRATRRSRPAAAPLGSGRRSSRQRRDWAGAAADVEKGEGKVTDQRASSGMGAIQRSPADSEENGGLPVSSDARGGSRTHDLFLRREALYPAELRTQLEQWRAPSRMGPATWMTI